MLIIVMSGEEGGRDKKDMAWSLMDTLGDKEWRSKQNTVVNPTL